ncbi:MAG: UDP-N-acetylmuramate dehydrogenase [Pseudomonadota bacterium]|nr:UDP-N-acetylmuramate dehydrogenase [Pseudomonadota bacterium]
MKINGEKEFASRISYNVPMSKHTSWRVGGKAEILFRPASRNELLSFMQRIGPEIPIYMIGLGSNLLIRDGGVQGIVIAVQDALKAIKFEQKGYVTAEAGVACNVLARNCVRRILGPAEFFAGIPGTVGGALAMNAGAFGTETWDIVESLEVVNRIGVVSVRKPKEYCVSYRQVDIPFPDEWFLSARFGFQENYETSMEKIKSLINQRRKKQPLGLPSCGSVFRNPPNDYAARLIEASGLKGTSIGGATISKKHANFIINNGSATASDIEELIQLVELEVAAKHKIKLQPEVHIIGEAAN